MGENELWILFAIVFIALMAFDLLISDRKPHEVSAKSALRNVMIYVAVAVAFGIVIFFSLGSGSATSYFAAYVIEFAMSVDNLFVFIIIFATFAIREADQHRVLFYGILGAIFFRAAFVFVGAELLHTFNWMMLVFGAILIFTAWKTAFGSGDDKPTEETFAYKVASRIKSADGPTEGKFFVKVDGKRVATAMLLCLVVIEVSDIMFAFDSIPAALSITTDIFLVFTSNIFAVMGLRSLFFVLRGALDSLCYLNYGLGVILAFIGAKMFLSFFGYEISVVLSLAVILVVLLITVAASRMAAKKGAKTA